LDEEEPYLKKCLFNWRGGLTGVAVFLLLWVAVFFIAFMTAFGNDSPASRAVLRAVAAFAIVANPLWGVPVAYGAGVVIGKGMTGNLPLSCFRQQKRGR
jgi:hypothetical protein